MQSLHAIQVVADVTTERVIMRALSDEGMTVRAFSARAEIEDALQRGGVDLLIVDLQLPAGAGLGLIAAAARQRPPVPSVAITGGATAEDVAEVWRSGAADIVFKPVTRIGLLAAVRRALAPARQISAVRFDEGLPTDSAVDEHHLRVSVPLTGDFDYVQRCLVTEAIRRFDGNKAAAARALGLHRRTLYRMIGR